MNYLPFHGKQALGAILHHLISKVISECNCS